MVGRRNSPHFYEKIMPIIGPIAPYSNVPIAPYNYQPSQFFISAVTLGTQTTVTTTVNNNYVIGQLVRLLIPPSFGCRQLNGQSAYVISIPNPNQVTLNLNSSANIDPFVTGSGVEQAQIMAIGDVNYGQINSNGLSSQQTYVPGSFINISP